MELPIRPRWHDKALCLGVEDSVFFPPEGTQSENRAAEEAWLLYCSHCPVRTQCLNSAIINGDWGIWAGTSTDLRLKIRRKKNRKRCPGCGGKSLVDVERHSLCIACSLSWEIKNNADSK